MSPAHLQHPQRAAATSTHLSSVPPAPTSSCLNTPHRPGCSHRGPCSRPTCPLPPLVFYLLFRFLSSGLRFSGFGGQVLPARRSPPGSAGPLQLFPRIRCIPRPCGKVTPPVPGQRHHPRANPGGPRMAVSGGATPAVPSCQLPELVPMGTVTPKPGTGQTCPCSPPLSPLPRPQGGGEGPGGVLGAGRCWERPCPLCAPPPVSGAVQISAGFFEMKIKLIKVGQILRPGPRRRPKQRLFLLPSRLPQL